MFGTDRLGEADGSLAGTTGADDTRKVIKGWPAVALVSGVVAAVTLLLRVMYHLPVADTLRWLFGVFFCLYVPGRLLLRWVRASGDDMIFGGIHAIALGSAVIPLVYAAFRTIGLPGLLVVFCLAALVIWLFPFLRDLRGGARFNEIPRSMWLETRSGLYALCLLALALLLLHFSHFTDVILTGEGFRFRLNDMAETDFHLGIINALRDAYPPQFPYASGTSFSHYHLAMHLEVEMFYRLLGISMINLSYFYFPLLFVILLLGAPFLLIRALFKSDTLAFVASLMVLGSDFSFIPGALGFYSGRTWTVIFQTSIWSLFTLNGQLPAVSFFFVAILHLKRFLDRNDLRELILFSLITYGMMGFKSSAGVHVGAAAVLTGLVMISDREKRAAGMKLLLASALVSAFMVLDITVMRGGLGKSTMIYFDPMNNFTRSLERLHILPHSMTSYIVLFFCYVAATFGIRVIGFTQIFRAIARPRDYVLVFLFLFIPMGFLLSEMLHIGIFIGAVNNAIWFSATSLIAAWIPVVYALDAWRRRGISVALASIIILSMAFPSTLQYFTRRMSYEYYDFRKADVEIIEYLDRLHPGTVVLHPVNQTLPSLAANFTGQPSVLSYFSSLAMMPITEADFLRRVKDTVRFFDVQSKIDRAEVIRRYGVTHVYAPIQFKDFLDQQSFLASVIKNKGYVLYAVRRT